MYIHRIMNNLFDIFITRYRNLTNLKHILPIVNPVNYNKIKKSINQTFKITIKLHSIHSNQWIKVYCTFWYLIVSSDVPFTEINAGNPNISRQRFGSFSMISIPTHCRKATQCKTHYIKGSVEFSTKNSLKIHAFDWITPDCI